MAPPVERPIDVSFSSDYSRATSSPWLDNKAASACMRCNKKFLLGYRHKHHCRKCGEIVCSLCSRGRETVEDYDPTKLHRVCDACRQTNDKEEALILEEVKRGESKGVRPMIHADKISKALPTGRNDLPPLAVLRVTVVEARGLVAADTRLMTANSSDPYCVLQIDDGPLVRTRTVNKSLSPTWNTDIELEVPRATSVLKLRFFDEDMAAFLDPDDPIGHIDVPLEAILSGSGAVLGGWMPISPPEDQAGPAGAVKLEVTVKAFEARQHLMSYLAPTPLDPPLPPPFNIDAVYSPAMQIVDLLWTRFVSPILSTLLDLIFWTSPVRSIVALFVWNVASARWMDWWSFFFWMYLICYVLNCRRQRDQNEDTNKATGSADATASCKAEKASFARAGSKNGGDLQDDANDVDEAHLGGFVQRLALVLPRGIKDTCVGLQPTLKTVADGLQLVHDLFTWSGDESSSSALLGALAALAASCAFLSVATQFMITGSLILLACSPVMTAFLGGISYLRWRCADHSAVPSTWRMREDYDDEAWSSEDYKRFQGVHDRAHHLTKKLKTVVGVASALRAAGKQHHSTAPAQQERQ
eukprot:TRINITY_DN121523_c0_g1_i1.p1 TRINITY_DN121523_c0_g1~~TRINITY_DN121523_c0_g1_i1.p1  ORF type:complete len:614 (+),score=82.88 TRINITY_DN121523_c0_g1_i1:89-1843(+)